MQDADVEVVDEDGPDIVRTGANWSRPDLVAELLAVLAQKDWGRILGELVCGGKELVLKRFRRFCIRRERHTATIANPQLPA